MLWVRQWPEVSDFVARFCTLSESENTRTCENCTQNGRIARETRAILACPCETRAILACPCVFGLTQCAKKCDTNHIPRATAYTPLWNKSLQWGWTLGNQLQRYSNRFKDNVKCKYCWYCSGRVSTICNLQAKVLHKYWFKHTIINTIEMYWWFCFLSGNHGFVISYFCC